MVLMGRLGRPQSAAPLLAGGPRRRRPDASIASASRGWPAPTPSEVSGGQLQRGLIARALVGDPEVLFLDEPTASIDAESRDTLRDAAGGPQPRRSRSSWSPTTSTSWLRWCGVIACINRKLFYHGEPELSLEVMEEVYGCPVELGHPRRAPSGAADTIIIIDRKTPDAELLDALSYEFLRNAVLAAVLASVLCGVIGTFVVVKKLAFISDGISHAAFGGMGLCFFFGIDPLLGAIPGRPRLRPGPGRGGPRDTSAPYDALIGVLWAVGMAVGVVFVYKTPGYAPNLMTYLFGNILLVTRRDLLAILILAVLGPCHAGFLLKGIVAVAFDEVFARVRGLPVRAPDGAAARG